MKNDNRPRAYRKDTLLTHLGRNPGAQHGAINPPVYHASTILSKNIAEWENRPDPRTHFGVVRYGLSGTPTTFALEELLAKIEGGYRAAIVCSGLAAITAPLQGLLSQGDHLLMVDSAYGPARNFCNRVLTRMGVETTYYDPLIGDGIAQLMRPNTKVVYVESPGSLTFEVQDVPAIAAVAHRHGAKVVMDVLGDAGAVPFNGALLLQMLQLHSQSPRHEVSDGTRDGTRRRDARQRQEPPRFIKMRKHT